MVTISICWLFASPFQNPGSALSCQSVFHPKRVGFEYQTKATQSVDDEAQDWTMTLKLINFQSEMLYYS